MASNDTGSIDDVLNGRRSPVIPFFWCSRDSELSRRLGAELLRLFERGGFGSLFIPVDSAPDAANWMQSPEIGAKIHPFALWENQRPWFVECRQSGDAAVSSEDATHLLPVSLRALAEGEADEAPPEAASGIRFAFDLSRPAAPNAERFTAVLAYFLFSAWLRFWNSRVGQLQEAFGLEKPGRSYYLGASWLGPAWGSLVCDRARPVLDSMVERWQGAASRPKETPCPEFNEFVRLAVPDRGYRLMDYDRDDPQVTFDNGEASLWLKMTERLPIKAKISWERRLGELLEQGQQVAVFSIRNALRWAETHVAERFLRVRDSLLPYLNPFIGEKPDRACLTAVEKRIEGLEAGLENLESIEVEECYEIESLEQNIAGLRDKILGMPSLKSAFLRVALIGLACAWLFLGSMLWARGAFTALDYTTRVQVGWVIGGGYALLIVLLLGRWVWYHFGVLRKEELVRRDIRADAARTLAHTVAGLGGSESKRIRSQLKGIAEALGNLRAECAKGIEPPASPVEEVPDPRFPKERLEGFFQDRFEASVRDAEDRFQVRMAAKDFTLDSDVWSGEAGHAAVESLVSIVQGIAFEEVAEMCRLESSDRKNLIQQSVRNARNILAPCGTAHDARALVFLADSWGAFLGERDTTELRDDPVARNGLMAVCAVPVPENGGAV